MSFTIINGQIYTPGLAIIDAPQPYTPLGGERNLTISNGTNPSDSESGYVGPVLDLEPGSTVKHVNWVWPRCFVGSGDGDKDEDDGDWRGEWNVTLHQAFRWEGEEYYTIFELPISVTNGIQEDEMRVACEDLENAFEKESLGVDGGLVAGEPWDAEDGTDNDSEKEDENKDRTNAAVELRAGGGLRFWGRATLLALVVGMVL
ncbi:uncharacterized protein BDW70DRAFT_170946 [Aspergillus foveolatus]|uniref:uncharacterized protein n=1 Tax=Aspergillus foveolatus TaxID=210207 RepID=UPI003CCD356A